MKADNDWIIERFKAKVAGSPTGANQLAAFQKALDTISGTPEGMMMPKADRMALAQEYVRTGVLDPMGGMGKQWASTGQAIGSRGISLVGQ